MYEIDEDDVLFVSWLLHECEIDVVGLKKMPRPLAKEHVGANAPRAGTPTVTYA
jgi:hypothetical protein